MRQALDCRFAVVSGSGVFVHSASSRYRSGDLKRRDTANLVGKEATAVTQKSMLWRFARGIGFGAARRLLVVSCVLLCCHVVSLSAAEPVSSQRVRASGDAVFRWQIGDAEASLFQGDCSIQHQGRFLKAESILLVSDGPQGKVRTRAVIAVAKGQPVQVVTFTTKDDPIVQSPHYRGPPKSHPELLRYLPDLKPLRIAQAGVSQAPNPDGSRVVQTQFAQDNNLSGSGTRGSAALGTSIPDGNPQLLAIPQNTAPSSSAQPFAAAPFDGGAAALQAPQTLQAPIIVPSANDPGTIVDSGVGSGGLNTPALVPSPLPDAGFAAESLPSIEVGPQFAPPSSVRSFQPPVTSGLPLESFPEPPATFSDGATTGGMFFSVGGGSRSVEINSRNSSMPSDIKTFDRPEVGETVIAASGGVTILVRDVAANLGDGQVIQLGTVSLSADRIVAWMPPIANLLRDSSLISQADGELYLEGDIVVRQGAQIIYAQRMYYNVAQRKGVVLDAEAITTIPQYEGVVRVKADVLQQINEGDFVAYDAALTSSRLGVPRYWLQSEQLRLNSRQRTASDRRTGQPRSKSVPWASSNNSFVYFGGVPLLWWPRFSTSLEYPTFYISGINVNNDSALGTQVLLDWNMFQLLGIENAPDGVDWELSTDYLSERGPAIGTTVEYDTPGFLGFRGPTKGFFDTWIIDDDGDDRLGLDRLNLEPERSTRGRSLLRHRQYLPNDYEFIAELGWISDRNFLEQYLENEWDQDKDHETGLRLRRHLGSQMFDLSANVQINDFFSETERLPALDHYVLGGSLGRLFTWSAHNHVSYSRVNTADTPENAAEAAEQSPIPGDSNNSGIVASTKQELSLPVGLGPIKVVPYISGQASHYGEALDGDSLTRLIGQAGIRASLPMSKSDSTIQSSLLNIRGLAHKLEWQAEYFFADSDTNSDELPFYDPLDDNAQEQFRRRFIQDTFGGFLPDQFDPRTYAFRQGLQRSVTNPSDVIADDLEQLRLGLHQRWQTKRGLPGRERIVDILQLDTDLLIFPNADRDNFGEQIGPATYDFRYHLGDRYSILSDGYFDFFDDGLRSVSAGIRTSRPGRGDTYIGLLSLEGPISSTVLRTSIDYRLNEKWIFSGGTSYDFGNTGNIGQTLGFTRIGESLLVRLQVNVDTGRDNVGVGFSISPRFWPSQRLGSLGGQLIPPPGVNGLE